MNGQKHTVDPCNPHLLCHDTFPPGLQTIQMQKEAKRDRHFFWGPLTSGLVMIFIAFLVAGCCHYVDASKLERNVPIMQGFFTFFPDSNVLTYKSNTRLKADNDVKDPIAFKLILPKKLVHYVIANSEYFGFFYPNNQVIYMHLDLTYFGKAKDSLYEPNAVQISYFIDRNTLHDQSKYDLGKIALKAGQRQAIITRNAATFLLYNIHPANFDLFCEAAKHLQFLNKL